MKLIKYISVFLTVALLVCCLGACADDTPDDDIDKTVYHTVTFKFQNGDDDYTIKVTDGAKVPAPIAPERDNYIFNGWKSNGMAWKFASELVFKDTTLVAQWIDASSVFSHSPYKEGSVSIDGYKGKLNEISIPKSVSGFKVEALGDEVFRDFNDPEATFIILPETLVSIGNEAFYNCKGAEVIVNGGISSLGEKAFDGCAKLESITLDKDLTTIPFRAFANASSLSEINIPEGVTSIGENAFDSCTAIQKMVIASRDFTVENGAFANCSNLKTIFFYGNETEWQNIASKVDNGGNANEDFLSAKVYFYSEQEPETDGNYWYMNNKDQPRCW